MAAFFFILGRGGWSWPQALASDARLYLQATTACLSAIIVLQMANLYECRSTRASVLATGLVDNRLIVAGIAVELALILLIDYTPWGNRVFGTAPIPAVAWLFALPFAAGLVALEETRKAAVRRLSPRA